MNIGVNKNDLGNLVSEWLWYPCNIYISNSVVSIHYTDFNVLTILSNNENQYYVWKLKLLYSEVLNVTLLMFSYLKYGLYHYDSLISYCLTTIGHRTISLKGFSQFKPLLKIYFYDYT